MRGKKRVRLREDHLSKTAQVCSLVWWAVETQRGPCLDFITQLQLTYLTSQPLVATRMVQEEVSGMDGQPRPNNRTRPKSHDPCPLSPVRKRFPLKTYEGVAKQIRCRVDLHHETMQPGRNQHTLSWWKGGKVSWRTVLKGLVTRQEDRALGSIDKGRRLTRHSSRYLLLQRDRKLREGSETQEVAALLGCRQTQNLRAADRSSYRSLWGG